MVASSKQIPYQIDGFASYRGGGGWGIRRVKVLALLVFFIMFFEHMSFEVSVRLNVQQLHCVENQISVHSPAD